MREIYLKTSFHLGHARSAIVAQGSTKISPGEQETLFSFDLVSQSFHNSAFFLDLILTSTSTLLLTFCSFLTHVLLYFTSYRLALLQRPNHLRLAATVTGYYSEFPKNSTDAHILYKNSTDVHILYKNSTDTHLLYSLYGFTIKAHQ